MPVPSALEKGADRAEAYLQLAANSCPTDPRRSVYHASWGRKYRRIREIYRSFPIYLVVKVYWFGYTETVAEGMGPRRIGRLGWI